MSNTTVTTQLTGKRLKLNKVIAYSLFVLGVLMILVHDGDSPDNHMLVWGCLISLYGLGHLTVTRIRIWWNHK